MLNKKENLNFISKYLPAYINKHILNLDDLVINRLCEIRLKADSPVVLVFTDRTSFITLTGRLTEYVSNELVLLDANEINQIFTRMCNYSVYSLTDNISDGFVTLSNGCRVGVYGTAVVKDGVISSVRNISGLNIRLSGQFNCISDRISDLYLNKNVNTLICGPPLSGKTTVLKDLCRVLSDKYKKRIALIDERGEFQFSELGVYTDVLSFYPKAKGINIAVRTLSPEIIVCDELGDFEEVKVVTEGLNAGVNFIMTMHAASYPELKRKAQFKELMDNASLDYCVFLKNKGEVERIVSFKEDEYERCGGFDIVNDCSTCRSVFFT